MSHVLGEVPGAQPSPPHFVQMIAVSTPISRSVPKHASAKVIVVLINAS